MSRAREALVRSPLPVVVLAACAWPVVAIGHQLALLAVAMLVNGALGAGTAATLVAGGGDEVYSRLALGMLAGAQPVGLALWPPAGDALHALVPAVFASPAALDPNGWSGVVFAAGSSSVGVQLTQLLVNLALAGFGAAVLVASYAQTRSQWLHRILSSRLARVLAALCLACGAGAQLGMFWGTGSGGEMALSMIATKILGLPSDVYDAAIASGDLLSMAINACLLAATVLAAAGVMLVALRLRRGRGGTLRVRLAALAIRPERAIVPAIFVPIMVAGALQPGIAFEPAGGPPHPTFSRLAPEGGGAAASAGAANPADAVAMHLLKDAGPLDQPPPGTTFQPGGSSVVTITPSGNTFEYRVNGHRTFIRGIGYNAITKNLSPDERAARFDRDFTEIRDAGANTLVGWDESEFDELLLGKAAEHDLGVILPFNLQSTWAYDDPKVRQQIMRDVAERVERFKDSPALRIWGLGNEVIHDMTKSRIPRAPAFAKFLIDTADLIHALDPAHPVVYRDAEDVYLAPVANALHADGQRRPWFIYGMNFFTTRMEDALTRGPTRNLRQPLLISEFGPVGLRPADRPAAYGRFWNIIRSHRDMLLGGFAYVWTTAGPEPLDRGFGLTNEAGEPVDGSISALGKLYSSEQDDDSTGASAGSLTSSR